jgi:hypothetical protein
MRSIPDTSAKSTANTATAIATAIASMRSLFSSSRHARMTIHATGITISLRRRALGETGETVGRLVARG